MNQVMKEISEKTQVKALFFDDALKSHEQEFELYYKYGTHWNAIGAYYGMEAMKAKMDPSYQAKNIKSSAVTEEVRTGVDSWYPLLSLAGMDKASYYEVVTENRVALSTG